MFSPFFERVSSDLFERVKWQFQTLMPKAGGPHWKVNIHMEALL
jgi:hypothetical protein